MAKEILFDLFLFLEESGKLGLAEGGCVGFGAVISDP